ncbi:MAG: DUF4625 domain-containing protein [Bacteroidales bacterium]
MRITIHNIIKISLILVFVLTAVSCEKDEDIKMPEILDFELGHDNSKTGYLGSDFHIEANIIAENNIDIIEIEIHYEGVHTKSIRIANGDDHHHWEIDTIYDKFRGLKNTTFHEHIKIPLNAEPGEYHFHFKVIDMEGYTAEIEEDLIIKEPEVTEVPVITITSSPSGGQTFSSDQTIIISGTVTHSLGVRGLYIGLVRSDTDYTDGQVNSRNSITLLHTHDFDNPANVSFEASVKVGAEYDNNITPKEITGDIAWRTGEYYLLVKSPALFGGPAGFSERIKINIDL